MTTQSSVSADSKEFVFTEPATVTVTFNPTLNELEAQLNALPIDSIKYLPTKTNKAKKLNNLERYFVSGAFSYGLTQEAAKKILYNQKETFSRADDWTVIAKDIKIYFVDILKHPEGYIESTIEGQRYRIHKKALDKIKYDGFFLTVKRNVYKVAILALKLF